METRLQVKSNFSMLVIPKAINGTTATAKTESNKSGAEKKHKTYKENNKAGKDEKQKTTKKFKLHPTISEKISPLLSGRNLIMRNLVRSVGLKKPYDLFLYKKICVTATLKG